MNAQLKGLFEKKNKIENTIKKLLQDFEEETQLRIENVNVQRNFMQTGGNGIITDVYLEVRL
jgi:hypothetical protein